MAARTIGTVVIDHCAACAGIWFDEGELQQGLAQGGKRELKQLSKSTAAVPDHDVTVGSCPRCSQHPAMTRTPSPTNPDLHVDTCLECGGVWYDGGEVDQLLDGGMGERMGRFLKGLVGR